VIADGSDGEKVTRTVHAGLVTWNALQPPAHQLAPAELAARAKRDGELVASPWFRSYVQTDPSLAWREVSCPVLALNGTRDVQVAADVNLRALRRALRHNPDLVARALPGLNHMFQPAHTGLVSEYGTIDTAIDESVVAQVVSFALARVSRHPS
jgi:pimeloyl-ACP methyl ester carboxylesterase